VRDAERERQLAAFIHPAPGGEPELRATSHWRFLLADRLCGQRQRADDHRLINLNPLWPRRAPIDLGSPRATPDAVPEVTGTPNLADGRLASFT
jgi:hypothetical protein